VLRNRLANSRAEAIRFIDKDFAPDRADGGGTAPADRAERD